jgi:hypothetical protein
MGNKTGKEPKKDNKPKPFVQPLVLTPTNKTPLESIDINALISEFQQDPNHIKTI